jgi:hypothetical protein
MKFGCCQQVRGDREEGESRDLQIALHKEMREKKKKNNKKKITM